MIGRLSGTLIDKQVSDILVDVGGVGYELQVPLTTMFRLPDVNRPLTLFTHLVVREDAQLLYGFYDLTDRALFRQLIKVNGVGPKLALTILSGMDGDQFARCVHDNDIKTLVQLPGVGRKTAERLLVEMRDRLADWAPSQSAQQAADEPAAKPGNIVADAEGALIALGYKPQEAAKAVSAANDDGVESSEELIRRALKSMVSS